MNEQQPDEKSIVRFVIGACVPSNPEHWSGWAWVELTKSDIKDILERRELLQLVVGKKPECREIVFWNWAVEFHEDYDDLYDSIDKETVNEFIESEESGVLYILEPDDEGLSNKELGFVGEDTIRTGLDYIHVHVDGIYFVANDHYSDEQYHTRMIKYEDLIEWAQL
jgi:hypothetical protein